MDNEKAFSGLMEEKGRHLNLTAGGQTCGGYFVGFKPREYLLVEVPRSAEIEGWLAGRKSVVGSFCVFGKVVRFESSIVVFLKKPAWLLVVAYPSRIKEIRDLRTSFRAECSIPCTLMSVRDLRKFQGLIVNLSTGGCKCILTSIPSSQVEMFNSEKQVLLEFELPGRHGKKGLFGEALYVDRDGAKVSLGIKFGGNDDQEALEELSEYVLSVAKLLSS